MLTSRLSKLVDVVFVLVSLGLLFMAIGNWRARPPQSPAMEDVLRRGNVHPVYAGIADACLLLFLSARCPYCTDSMPLYRDLQRLADGSGGKLRLRFESTNDPSEFAQYLSAHGVRPGDAEQRQPLAGVRGTPTLVLFGRRGDVVASWTGRLTKSQEDVLRKALNTLIRNGG